MTGWVELSRQRDEREQRFSSPLDALFSIIDGKRFLTSGMMVQSNEVRGVSFDDVIWLGYTGRHCTDVVRLAVWNPSTSMFQAIVYPMGVMIFPMEVLEVDCLMFSTRLALSYKKSYGYKHDAYMIDRQELEEWVTTQDVGLD